MISIRSAPFVYRLALVALALFAFLSIHASADTPKNFSGHYELLVTKDRVFTLNVKQDDDRAKISFSASMSDGSGASPDAEGKGSIDDGVLNFKFKDSFNNEGTGVLTFKHNAYRVSLTVTKAVDPSPFHFYGDMALKQVSARPDN
jgi:hypothetical protein